MSYLFNDDKSKRDIVVLDNLIQNLRPGEKRVIPLSEEYLTYHGIDRAWKYSVIGAETRALPNFNNYMHNSSMIPIEVNIFTEAIEAIITNNYTETQTYVNYRIILMRTSED